MDLMDNIKRTK